MSAIAHEGSSPTISDSAAALPFDDSLVVVTGEGAVCALDPAGRALWEALATGSRVEDLVAAAVRWGGLAPEAARSAILDTLASWREFGLLRGPCAVDRKASTNEIHVRTATGELALDAIYLVGDRPVRVRCENPDLGELIEAGCASFRLDGRADARACVDVIEEAGRFAVRADDTIITAGRGFSDSLWQARHICLSALAETARYPRPLLGILHASAVAEDGRCVALPGVRGSGKTTLAAGLVATGSVFVADDYIPVEQGTWLAWPVPYAFIIKKGSQPLLGRYFPSLNGAPAFVRRATSVRWLAPEGAICAPLDQGLPIRALVFPRFEAGAALRRRPLTGIEVLTEICRAGTLFDRRPEILRETLRWIRSVPAYELVFGDLESGMEGVREVLRRA